MKYVNLGCGARYIDNWENFDFISNSPYVNQVNLLSGIPISAESADFVYHSHVLEHFTKEQGEKFLEDCFRILKSGGILRIVIPDLEQIVINYLNCLNNARNNNSPLNNEEYNWSLIELLDQLVREVPGGEMLKVWKQDVIVNENQLLERVGEEFVRIRKSIIESKKQTHSKLELVPKKTLKQRLKSFLLKYLHVEEQNLIVGNVRNSGEIHKWMYDSYALSELLKLIGFREIKVVNANTSNLKNWEEFKILDVENGLTRKPDSLFIEAIK